MPRRNLYCLLLLLVVSWVCYAKTPRNRCGGVLADALDRVDRRYYRSVDDVDLFEGAMSGMIGRLHDDYSKYISVEEKTGFEQDLDQEIVGIGIRPVIDPRTKQLLVLSPLAGSPAFAKGMRAGDRILKIDGQSTQGLSLESAAERIRGKSGTTVTLTVQKPGAAATIELPIVRQVIHEDTVQGDMLGADGRWIFLLPGQRRIGYIRITAFVDADGENKGTAADFRAALEQLRAAKIAGLVLDLRDNLGGSLNAAVEICDMLVPQGDIVTTRGRDGRILNAYRASGRAPFTDFPIAVLVNRSTASASEIVAACLQDHDRAVIVGERTYGKGTVQEVDDLGQTLGAMKLTIATYWRPSGQDINRPRKNAKQQDASGNGTKKAQWGVAPNAGYEVSLDERQQAGLWTWQRDRELAALHGDKAGADDETPDRALAKAVEYLEKPRS